MTSKPIVRAASMSAGVRFWNGPAASMTRSRPLRLFRRSSGLFASIRSSPREREAMIGCIPAAASEQVYA